MNISYVEFEQNLFDVIDELAEQDELRKEFPDHPEEGIFYGCKVMYMPFDHHIEDWRTGIRCGEAWLSYESIVAVNDKKSCHLKGKNVIKLILVALYLNDYIDYERLLDKPISFADDKRLILSDENCNQYLFDVIDDLFLQTELKESIVQDGKDSVEYMLHLKTLIECKKYNTVYQNIIALLNQYLCQLNGKNVVKLIQVALSFGNDIDYEHLLKK